MTPLDVRAPDAGAAGSAKSFSSKRQESAPGFGDAFNVIGGQSTAAKKGKSTADEAASAPSSGKGLSWDPRMKDAGSPVTDAAVAPKDALALPGASDEAADAREDDPENRDGDKNAEEIAAATVPLMAIGANALQNVTAKDADGSPAPRMAPAWAAARTGVLSGQAGSENETAPERLASESRGPLVAQIGEDKARSGTSALAALGSRLAELSGDGTSHAGEGATKGEASRAGTAKAEAAVREKLSAETAPKPHDANAATRTDAPSGLTALSLPGAPFAAGRNVSAITAGIVGSPAWSRALASPDLAAARPANPVNALRIQLHPADLGVVTATLRLSGDHLVINLKVETAAAYRQLSADNRAIVDKLKGHGYVVESIAVQHVAVDRPAAPQPQQATGFTNPQTGGQAMADGGGRPFGQGGGSGGESRTQNEGVPSRRETASPAGGADRGPGGLYV